MISQVSATASSGQVYQLNSGSVRQSVLPAENSVVLVNVLERLNVNYRLLIDGSVFQARLPLMLAKGDAFLARVLKQKPLTIQADSIGRSGSSQAFFSAMAQKLGLKGKKAEEILSAISRKKSPIIKSRLDWILDKADSAQNLDQLQMQLIIALSGIPVQELDERASSVKKLFSRSLLDLIQEIFFYASETLKAKTGNLDIKAAINSVLIFQPVNEAFSHEKGIIDLSARLQELENRVTGSERKKLHEFISNLIEYVIQKAIYNFFAIYPSFIIKKVHNIYYLHTFNHSHLANNSYSIVCDGMDDRKTETFVIRGAYNHPALHLECSSATPVPVSEILNRSISVFMESGINAYWKFTTGTALPAMITGSVNSIA